MSIAMFSRFDHLKKFAPLLFVLSLIQGCSSTSLPQLPSASVQPGVTVDGKGDLAALAVRRRVANAETRAVDLGWSSKVRDQKADRPSLGFGGASQADKAKLERIFYGTSRAILTDPKGDRYFSENRADALTLGYATVAIPWEHKTGEIEKPVWLFSPRLGRHFMLTELYDVDPPYFDELVGQEAKDSIRKRVLVYVHGIANAFNDAAFRAAQLKHDLGFDGPVVFFSWPSGSGPMGYEVANNNAEWSAPYLRQLLRTLLTDIGNGEIVLITHSMGIKLTSLALRELGPTRRQIDELILASPDIDAQIFVRDIAPALASGSNRISIYTSERDRALQFSQWAAGETRLGGTTKIKFKASNIDVIDTAVVSTGDFLGHSDFAESPPAIKDLSFLINQRLPAAKRVSLTRINTAEVAYWQVRP